MPMPRADGLLNRQEVATTLGVTRRHVANWVREGRLLPTYAQGEELFRPEEVHGLSEIRTRRVDAADAANLALQAHTLSRSTQQRLDKLCLMLGMGVNRLSTHEDSIHALHLKVLDTLQEDLTGIGTGAVMEWTSVLYGVDESYLRLLEAYLLDEEPWAPYLRLANHIMEQATALSSTRDMNTRFAFTCLDSARKSMRHVTYFYIRTKHGATQADELFEESVDEQVIGQLYPTTIGPH